MRIASQQRSGASTALDTSDELLSFGCYPYSNSSFQSHASLTASATGNLTLKAAALQLLPAGGDVNVGSGTFAAVSCSTSAITCLTLEVQFLYCLSSSGTKPADASGHVQSQKALHRLRICSFLVLPADGSKGDLNVYGNIIVRPQTAPASTSAGQRRRKLQQSGK